MESKYLRNKKIISNSKSTKVYFQFYMDIAQKIIIYKKFKDHKTCIIILWNFSLIHRKKLSIDVHSYQDK